MADDRTKPHPLYWTGRNLEDSDYWSVDFMDPEDLDTLCYTCFETESAALHATWRHADALRREGYRQAVLDVALAMSIADHVGDVARGLPAWCREAGLDPLPEHDEGDLDHDALVALGARSWFDIEAPGEPTPS